MLVEVINDSMTQELPSLGEQGKNLSDTLAKTMQAFVNGDELFVDDFERKRRYDICQACEHFIKKRKRCAKCGCFLQQKVKMKMSSCPIKKW